MTRKYNHSYIDKGCEFAASCLNCPFPKCIYEEPKGRQSWQKEQRDSEIVRLLKKGKSISDLALVFGISKRTIQRVIKKCREDD